MKPGGGVLRTIVNQGVVRVIFDELGEDILQPLQSVTCHIWQTNNVSSQAVLCDVRKRLHITSISLALRVLQNHDGGCSTFPEKYQLSPSTIVSKFRFKSALT